MDNPPRIPFCYFHGTATGMKCQFWQSSKYVRLENRVSKRFTALGVTKLADVKHLAILFCDVSKLRIRNVKILFQRRPGGACSPWNFVT